MNRIVHQLRQMPSSCPASTPRILARPRPHTGAAALRACLMLFAYWNVAEANNYYLVVARAFCERCAGSVTVRGSPPGRYEGDGGGEEAADFPHRVQAAHA